MKNMNNKINRKTKGLDLTLNNPAYKKYYGMMDARVKLAVEINEARVVRGWSQQELASEAETTQKVISKIESGDTNLGFDLLNKIAKPLNLRLQIGTTVFVAGLEPTVMNINYSAPESISMGIYPSVSNGIKWDSYVPTGVRFIESTTLQQMTSTEEKSDTKIEINERAYA